VDETLEAFKLAGKLLYKGVRGCSERQNRTP
jgi:hypothetical protein